MQTDVNIMLQNELSQIEDPLVRDICRLAVSLAQEANKKQIPNVADHVANVLDTKLTPLFKDSK